MSRKATRVHGIRAYMHDLPPPKNVILQQEIHERGASVSRVTVALHSRVYTRKSFFCDFLGIVQPPLGFPIFCVIAPHYWISVCKPNADGNICSLLKIDFVDVPLAIRRPDGSAQWKDDIFLGPATSSLAQVSPGIKRWLTFLTRSVQGDT